MSLEDQPKIIKSTDKEWMEYYRNRCNDLEKELALTIEVKRRYQGLLGEERKKSIDERMKDGEHFLSALTIKQKMIIDSLQHQLNKLNPVMEAARNWWLNKKPVSWSIEDFWASPRTNSCTDAEARLAEEIAKADSGGFDSD